VDAEHVDGCADLGHLEFEPNHAGDGPVVRGRRIPLLSKSISPRGGASLTTVGDLVFVIGGSDRTGNHLNDVHTIASSGTVQTIQASSVDCPLSPRSGHSAVLAQNMIVVFGGANMVEGACYNDVQMFDTELSSWCSAFAIAGQVPEARNSHSAVVHESRGQTHMILFGGASTSAPLNDLHRLDLSDVAVPAWDRMSVDGPAPEAREMHSATVVQGNMVIAGGRAESGAILSDVWTLSLDELSWSRCRVDIKPPRCAHASAAIGSSILLFGGIDGQSLPSSLSLLDVQGGCTVVSSKPAFRGRFGVASSGLNDGLLVFGGVDMEQDYSDLIRFELEADVIGSPPSNAASTST